MKIWNVAKAGPGEPMDVDVATDLIVASAVALALGAGLFVREYPYTVLTLALVCVAFTWPPFSLARSLVRVMARIHGRLFRLGHSPGVPE